MTINKISFKERSKNETRNKMAVINFHTTLKKKNDIFFSRIESILQFSFLIFIISPWKCFACPSIYIVKHETMSVIWPSVMVYIFFFFSYITTYEILSVYLFCD